MDGNTPQWDDIISGEWNEEDSDSPHRHIKEPDTFGHVLQLVTGIAFLLAIIAIFQLVWQTYGNELDAIHTQETIAINNGFDETIVPDSDKIARSQAGEPPVDPQPAESGFIGWMYIPRFGLEWKRAIQEGVDPSILANLGLGHYEQTVMPGAVGNTAYAGHRTPSDLGYADRLQAGDSIIIQTNTTWYVYTVQKSWIVPMSDVSVLASQGDERTLTLTTCDPMYQVPAPNRLIIRANFDYWANTADGIPAELSDQQPSTPVQDTVANITKVVRDISKHAPITTLLFAAVFVLWLVFNGICWLAFRRERELKAPTWNVLTLLWRLQCGPAALRVIQYMLMWMAILFACWAWLCPFLASNVPWLETPYPGLQ